jgi:predicted O-methyltransferase YrrM
MFRPTLGNLLILKHYLTRRKRALAYYSKRLEEIERWSSSKTEFSNFYYDLEESNLKDLASLLALILNVKYELVMHYFTEVRNDRNLHSHIEKYFAQDGNLKDSKTEYARRVGWYAIARILKPVTIVETGVAQGMGSCILSLALMNNSKEGAAGRYYGTDIDPNAGGMYSQPYSSFGKILYGDSIQSLRKLNVAIDLFINDSNHDSDYERSEYESIKKNLTQKSFILGDNSHVSDSLRDFSIANDREYAFFREVPKDHWYPGAGIGISFTRQGI